MPSKSSKRCSVTGECGKNNQFESAYRYYEQSSVTGMMFKSWVCRVIADMKSQSDLFTQSFSSIEDWNPKPP